MDGGRGSDAKVKEVGDLIESGELDGEFANVLRVVRELVDKVLGEKGTGGNVLPKDGTKTLRKVVVDKTGLKKRCAVEEGAD